MKLSDHLHKFPFLRLLLPFAGGIVLGDYLFFREVLIPLNIGLLVPGSIVFLLIICYFLKTYSLRWLFGGCLSLLFFVMGILGVNLQLQNNFYDFPEEEKVYKVAITGKPEPKEKSILYHAHILERQDSLHIYPVDKKALLYFAVDSLSNSICEGDVLLVSSTICLPGKKGNPEEFDYPRYLQHKGISATGFINSGRWKIIDHAPVSSLQAKALKYREKVLALYRSLGFSNDEFSVLSALTVGYKDELSEEIQETFSISGASHVLALSGLHIGLLSGLLVFFLNLIPIRRKGFMFVRAVLLIAALWGFAFITGLSSSVVRSVIMFSILSLAYFHTGRTFTLNTLASAGLLMLVYNPCWLFDVGFQLSFCAVGAILLIHPWIYKRLKAKNDVLNFFSELLSVSVSAQIGTAPLVLLYFHRFSTHFLITNIIVVPLVMVIIYMAVVMLILSPLPLLSKGIAAILNYVIKALNTSVRYIENLPFSSFDNIWIYRLEALFFFIILLFTAYYIASRKAKPLIFALSFILVTSIYGTYMRQVYDKPRKSLIFYNVRNCPVVHCIEQSGKSWLVCTEADDKLKFVSKAASAFWSRLRLSSPIPVASHFNENELFRKDSFLSFHNKRISIINDNSWNTCEAVTPLAIDYLYLCRGYTGSLQNLSDKFQIKCLVLDASLTSYRRTTYREECKQMNIPFIDLSEKASVILL